MTNRPETHTDAATWHLDRARRSPLSQREHIAIAQVEALLALAEALRTTDRTTERTADAV
jgi:hypothetical protein